jgi:hypothetical protein
MTDMKRWGLKHEGRDFIVYQETKEKAVALFAKELGDAFRLTAPPLIEDIDAAIHELGLHEGEGRVLVDNNPARETRQAHVEPGPLAKIIDNTITACNGVAKQLEEHLANGTSEHGPLASMMGGAALERMKNRAKGNP